MNLIEKTRFLFCCGLIFMTSFAHRAEAQSDAIFTFLEDEFIDFQGYDRLNDSIYLYFGSTFDSTYIWRTNGTEKGSYIIHRSQFRFGSGQNYWPDYLGSIQGKAYFIIYHPIIGKEIWVVNEHGTECALWEDRIPGLKGLHSANKSMIKPKSLNYNNNLYMVTNVDTIGYEYLCEFNESSGLTVLSEKSGGFANYASSVFLYNSILYYFSHESIKKFDLISGDEGIVLDNLDFDVVYDFLQKDSIVFLIVDNLPQSYATLYIFNLESGILSKSGIVTVENEYPFNFPIWRETRMFDTQYGVFFSLVVDGRWAIYRTDGTVAGTQKLPITTSTNTQYAYMPQGFTDWGDYVYFYYRRTFGLTTLARWSPSGGLENVKDFSANVTQNTKMELFPWKDCFVLPFSGLVNGSSLPYTSPWLYCPASDTWALLVDPASSPNLPYEPQFFSAFNEQDIWYVAVDNYDQLFIIKDLQVSVEGISQEDAIKLYPNPVSDILWLSGLTTSQMDYGTCQILDLLGNTLLRNELAGSPAIDISSLPAGSYYMSLRTSDNIITKPFVKM